jgi:plastocyanin
MASPELLDDRWRAGLEELADPPRYSPDAQERTQRRAAQRRRRNGTVRVAGACCLLLAAGLGLLRAAHDDSSPTVGAGAPRHVVYAGIQDGRLDFSPPYIAPGDTVVRMDSVDFHGGGIVTLHLPGGGSVVYDSDCATCAPVQASFVAEPEAHYDLVATGPTGNRVAAGTLDVEPSGPPVATVDVNALPSLKFDPDRLVVPAGIVEFRLHDVRAGQHTFAIGTTTALIEVNNAGQVGSAKVRLAPGTYTFHCTVPGHREAGMEGTLVVEGR